MLVEDYLLCQPHKGERCEVYTSADVVHSGIYKGEQASTEGLFLVLLMDGETKNVYKNIGTTSGDAVGDSICIPIVEITKMIFE